MNKKSPLFAALQAKVAAYNAGIDLLEAHILELNTWWAAFAPNNFNPDRLSS